MTKIRLFVAAAGNEFMLDIAGALREGFLDCDFPCTVETDRLPQSETSDLQIVVAPHEYVPLTAAQALSEQALRSLLGAVSIVNVEQPGSSWFDLAFEYARQAGMVFDISREGTAEFRRRGILAHHSPLGVASWFVAPQQLPLRERPIDVLFMGHASPRRDQFIARHGDFFSNPRCHIVLTDVARPRTLQTAGYYSGADRLRLVGASRILLNVHSADRAYFETHRAMLALANGCLLITETSSHTEPLIEGEHFAMAPLDQLAALSRSYLDDPKQAERLAIAGQAFASQSLSMRSTCQAMLEVLQARTETPASHPSLETAWDADSARAAVMGRLARAQDTRRLGQADRDLLSNSAYAGSKIPAVSVVITLYNYEAHIRQCLQSVIAAEPPDGGVELVVVNDGSTDASAAEAWNVLDQAAIPSLFVSKHSNTGLADARNVGFEHARAETVFVLDADNWIYPTCLRALHRQLGDGDYAAAYGFLRRFSDQTGESLGLVSKFEWNVRDLVRAPYIDAMALFRRKSVIDVGGYATELIEHGWFGWEDYALWLALAEAGLSGKLVPIVVGAYREHSGSMIHRTNTSTEAIARYFGRRFASLVRQHRDLDRYFGFPASLIVGNDQIPAEDEGRQPSEIEALHTQCLELQRQVDDLHASVSWRLTAPLRALYSMITRPAARP